MKFPPGNKIVYGQDMAQWVGVPDDVDFLCECCSVGRDGNMLLRFFGPGYGGKPYGNGALFIYAQATLAKEMP